MSSDNTSTNSKGTEARPVELLLGQTLEGGWRVVGFAPTGPESTGGHFSLGYIVESGSRRAFLKALDLSAAAAPGGDLTRSLEKLTTAFNFERDLLERCRERKLGRVVRALESGTTHVDGFGPLEGSVPYIIFELADGDLRWRIASESFNLALLFRTLHHVAVGLRQLHSVQITHQDLKPSNVLVFGREGSKLGDLGRAVARDRSGPYDGLTVAGASAYAPPELLYGYCDSDWNLRRLGCDTYLLGSLAVFLFTSLPVNALLFQELEASHHYRSWSGTFDEILPHLRDAFGRTIARINDAVPMKARLETMKIVSELCDPDPARRGDRGATLRGVSPFDLQRYISRLNILAHEAEFGLLGALAD